ncbi:hypothetical protein CGRA01v4_08295 [Colletotrichum graminicola]|nr:hypothetical protein CGRA01v4_08295 [Colletotrichum graminicola]
MPHHRRSPASLQEHRRLGRVPRGPAQARDPRRRPRPPQVQIQAVRGPAQALRRARHLPRRRPHRQPPAQGPRQDLLQDHRQEARPCRPLGQGPPRRRRQARQAPGEEDPWHRQRRHAAGDRRRDREDYRRRPRQPDALHQHRHPDRLRRLLRRPGRRERHGRRQCPRREVGAAEVAERQEHLHQGPGDGRPARLADGRALARAEGHRRRRQRAGQGHQGEGQRRQEAQVSRLRRRRRRRGGRRQAQAQEGQEGRQGGRPEGAAREQRRRPRQADLGAQGKAEEAEGQGQGCPGQLKKKLLRHALKKKKDSSFYRKEKKRRTVLRAGLYHAWLYGVRRWFKQNNHFHSSGQGLIDRKKLVLYKFARFAPSVSCSSQLNIIVPVLSPTIPPLSAKLVMPNLQLLAEESGLRLGLEVLLVGAKELLDGLVEALLGQPHVLAGDLAEAQATLAVQLPEADPVLLVDGPGAQRQALGAVDLLEPGRLLGDDGGVVLEHDHDEVGQAGEVLLVPGVLELALIVDVGQEVGRLEVLLVLGGVGVAVVLGGHEAVLDEAGPGVEAEQGHGALAEQVGVAAGLELDDAVVLTAVGDEGAHGGVVAALDVAAEELAALREADGVDGGGGGQDGVRGEGLADLLELRRHVAEEGGGPVAVGVGADLDCVDIGAWVDLLGQLAHLLDAFAIVRVAKAVPDDERDGVVVGGVVGEGPLGGCGRARDGGQGTGCEEPRNGERFHCVRIAISAAACLNYQLWD